MDVSPILKFYLNQNITARIIRFGIIGLLSGLTFIAVVFLAVLFANINPKIASTIGYFASLPVNFVGNKYFSFQSNNSIRQDVSRFGVVHVFNAALSFLIMGLMVDLLHYTYQYGVVATVVCIPVLNFIVLNYWVFKRKTQW
jgi:putative flippase GtrA